MKCYVCDGNGVINAEALPDNVINLPFPLIEEWIDSNPGEYSVCWCCGHLAVPGYHGDKEKVSVECVELSKAVRRIDHG